MKVLWMRRLLSALVFLGLALILGYGALLISRSPTFQLLGEIVSRVETMERVVALTFDDGPSESWTREILNVLRKKGVKATFFVVGSELERRPELGRLIVQQGHELGNHSYSHRRMMVKGLGFITDEIERTDLLIRASGYSGPIQFRPPYGKKLVMLPYYLKSRGRKSIMADIQPDSIKALDGDAEEMVRYVGERAQPGSIILMHVMYKNNGASRAAIPGIIVRLRSQGYTFVTLSELLSKQAC
jgi:chitin deacetylase